MDRLAPMPGLKTRLPGTFRRWLPVAVLALLIVTVYGFGLHRHLSLESLAQHRGLLRSFVDQHIAAAILLYVAVYVALVALSIPGAAVMSIAGGFLFGWMISVPATVTAAVAGSVIVFQIVKTTAGAALAERAGSVAHRLSCGFADNAFSYLLFLRLAPVFPFFMVNAIAGLSRVPLRTFVTATAIGIIPASFAFALVGAGLDNVITARMAAHHACVAANTAADCSFGLEVSDLVTPQLVIAFTALGVIALIPVIVKHVRRQKQA
jgi:uncharacterized membrane protein YdjX (TVP38/TMEM64 family)